MFSTEYFKILLILLLYPFFKMHTHTHTKHTLEFNSLHHPVLSLDFYFTVSGFCHAVIWQQQGLSLLNDRLHSYNQEYYTKSLSQSLLYFK